MALLILGSCSKKSEEKMNMTVEEHAVMDSFKISDAQLKLANIEVMPAEIKNISEEILLTGSIVPDENKSSQINSRIMGRIDKLYFKFTGENIHKGDLLYELYSEELQTAQKDLLFASQQAVSKSNNNVYFNQLKESAKNKLLLWGLTEAQVAEIEQTNEINITTKFYSNTSGTITGIMVREGDYVMQGAPLFMINDLRSLWVEAQLYSSELAKVKNFDEVKISVEGFSKQNLKSRISFVSPELNNNSIVNIIRAEIQNPNQQFKPGMFATIRLITKTINALVLPVDAVLQEARGNSVWIRNNDGTFENRMVLTGIRNNDEIEITTGVEEGENVVISGAYLINSEYILKRDADPMAGMKM